MILFESRAAGDGTHYAVASGNGQLAHTEHEDGSMRAAVGLTRERADGIVRDLNTARAGQS